jgi:hypothetical protein
MGIAMAFGVSGMVLLFHPILADFRIEGTTPPSVVVQAPAQLAPPLPAEGADPPPRPVARWRPPVAAGFGQDVPLEFAVRQITPRWVHVSYGDTVDRQARVTWKGGRAWNQVLGGVLAPLGLHMRMSGRTLWIQG